MHGFIYDVFTGQKQHEKELIRIENTLTDLGIKGPIVKLSLINNINHAIEELIRKGVDTIIAVGSDQLLSKIADSSDRLNAITLGIIPLGSHQQLATLLGVPYGHNACHTVSARLVRPVSLGKINNAFFIYSVLITDPRIKIKCEGQFIISPVSEKAVTTILNLQANEDLNREKLSVTISPEYEKKLFKKQKTVFPTTIQCTHAVIEYPENVPIIVDGQKIMKTPVFFEIVPQKINIIMGKERKIGFYSN